MTILMGGVRDPYILAQIHSWLAQLEENIKARIRNTVGEARFDDHSEPRRDPSRSDQVRRAMKP